MSKQSSSGDGVGIVGLLGVVFVALKLTGHIDWSWWWVTCPFWIGLAILLLIGLVALVAWLVTVAVKRIANKPSRHRGAAWTLALLGACLAACGCVTDDLSGGAIGAVQTGVDVVAAKYGAAPYVAGAREKLAEAEAAKVGRVLLPRGVGLAYDSYLDGRMINEARIQRIPRLVGVPAVVVTTSAPPDVASADVVQDDPPHPGISDDDQRELDEADAGLPR